MFHEFEGAVNESFAQLTGFKQHAARIRKSIGLIGDEQFPPSDNVETLCTDRGGDDRDAV